MDNYTLKNHSILVAVTITILIFSVIAAGCNKLSSGEENIEDDNVEISVANGTQSNGEKTLTIKLFFADNKLIAEDRPGQYGYVVPILRSIPYTPDETIALQVTLKELIRGPLTSDAGDLFFTIPETTQILGVKIEDKTAIINFSGELLADSAGGTMVGKIFRESIIYTVTQCPSVKDLIVLVEDKPWSDGHYVWDTPLSEKDITASAN